MSSMYCGIRKIPKGRERGTPEHCLKTKQVRYYGLVKIDKNLLEKVKGKPLDLQSEVMKLRKLEYEARYLLRIAKNLIFILEDERMSMAQKKSAQKKMDKLLIKRDKLLEKYKKQKKIVDDLTMASKKN
ncbi:MAG: hypothetical protein QXW79_00325 [Thermoplasmata archaeon]